MLHSRWLAFALGHAACTIFFTRLLCCCPLCFAADANILINMCRLSAQRYNFAYQEPMPVEQLVRSVCDTKQVRTQACCTG